MLAAILASVSQDDDGLYPKDPATWLDPYDKPERHPIPA
jgi:hypothetical protein